MIIVHDENLVVQHVIFEHPPGYEAIIDGQGHRWVKTQAAIGVDQIVIAPHAQTGAREVRHRELGHALPVIATSNH